MSRKFFSACLALCISTVAYSQDSTKPSGPTITGSVDAYYRHNFSNPTPVPGSVITNVNNFTSFTNSHKSYELGMASIRADHSFGLSVK